MSKKRPVRKFNPKDKLAGAMPDTRRRVETNSDHSPVWQLKNLDMDHPNWGWNNLRSPHLAEVLKKLKDYETMLWKEILGNQKHAHTVDVGDLTLQARKRLIDLKLDDRDELLRLRFTGKQRVWGILDGYIFKVLWWDPEHTVCPSVLKNT